MVILKSNIPIWILGVLFLAGCSRQQAKFETPLEAASRLLAENDVAGAIEKCEAELAKHLDNPKAWKLLIEAYRQQGRSDEMLTACNRAIELRTGKGIGPHIGDEEYLFIYQCRQDYYLALAEKAGHNTDEYWDYNDLVLRDAEKMKELHPEKTVALAKSPTVRKARLVTEAPIPSYESDENGAVDKLDEFKFETDAGESLAGEDDASDKESEGDSSEEQPDVLKETAPEYADRLAREAEEIRAKELEEELSEPTLPPHLEPTAEPEPPVPMPITRFSLPTRDDGSIVLPNFRGNVATGIRAPSERTERTDDASGSDDEYGPTNRFYLQNQFGSIQQGVRTGIGSSRSATQSSSVSSRFQFQSGLLPQDARNSFGPRLGPRSEEQRNDYDTALQRERRSEARSGPAPNTPVLTTALPGTTMLYGVPSGAQPRGNRVGLVQNQATLSTALPPSLPNGRSPTDSDRFGKVSDPSFTPFGKRPTPSATPTLPPVRTSN